MAWPSSRLQTYVANVTPVKAADLNAIQDAIVGGIVIGKEYPYGASNFQKVATSGAGTLSHPDLWSGVVDVISTLKVPQGHKIEQLRYAYSRQSLGTCELFIGYRDWQTSGSGTVSAFADTTSGAVQSVATINAAALLALGIGLEAPPADRVYNLRVSHTNAANFFKGVYVKYSKLA